MSANRTPQFDYAIELQTELYRLGEPVALGFEPDATLGPLTSMPRIRLTTTGKGREGLQFTVAAGTLAVPVVSPDEKDFLGQAKTTQIEFNRLAGVAQQKGITTLELSRRIDNGDLDKPSEG